MYLRSVPWDSWAIYRDTSASNESRFGREVASLLASPHNGPQYLTDQILALDACQGVEVGAGPFQGGDLDGVT